MKDSLPDQNQQKLLARAVELTQLLFDETISGEESIELSSLWKSLPLAKTASVENFQIERLFRYRTDLHQAPDVDNLNELKVEAYRRFGVGNVDESSSKDDLLSIEMALNPEELRHLEMISDVQERNAREKDGDSEVRTNHLKPRTYSKPAEKQPSYFDRFLRFLFLPALLAFVVLIYSEFKGPSESSPRDGVSKRPVATIVDSADIVWSGRTGLTTFEPGSPLYSERLSFSSGALELLFFNGVRCFVEGPADIVLIDRKHVFCQQGRWSATVPEQGTGFEIQTPRGLIRDIGTKFYADIRESENRVHVLEGVVEVEETGRDKIVLKKNEAVTVDVRGKIDRFLADTSLFLLSSEMRSRSGRLFPSRSFSNQSTATSKKAVFEFDLDTDTKNHTVYGCSITEGRLGHIKAIALEKPTDRIRLHCSKTVKTLSSVAWVRINRLQEGPSPILTSEGSERGGILWQVSSEGSVVLGWRHQTNKSVKSIESPIVFTKENLGRWVQLAFVLDSVRQTATVYMDGLPILCEQVRKVPPISLKNLDLGNWKTGTNQSKLLQSLDGAVGTVSIFDQLLNSYETRHLYETCISEQE